MRCESKSSTTSESDGESESRYATRTESTPKSRCARTLRSSKGSLQPDSFAPPCATRIRVGELIVCGRVKAAGLWDELVSQAASNSVAIRKVTGSSSDMLTSQI